MSIISKTKNNLLSAAPSFLQFLDHERKLKFREPLDSSLVSLDSENRPQKAGWGGGAE